jgi:simple sugar transport system permease protein
MSEAMLTAFMLATFASMIPLLLAALGESIGEQSGVLNVGLEGVLLVGGFAAFAATLASGSFWLGFLAGALAGAALQAVLMVLSVWLNANQIVVGIGMTLAGTGVSSMLYDWSFAESRPRLGLPDAWVIYPLSEIPVAGPVLFARPGMFTLTFVLVAATAIWLSRTAPGLRLRAAGQRPAALDAAGGSVVRVRSLAVLFGGAMAGLGGAYLSLVSAGTFTPGMTHGLGFLAIVVAMLARGRMRWVVAISLIYGLFVATGTALQLTAVNLPNDVITMAPFVAVMLVLAFTRKGSALPPALATPYVRGAR